MILSLIKSPRIYILNISNKSPMILSLIKSPKIYILNISNKSPMILSLIKSPTIYISKKSYNFNFNIFNKKSYDLYILIYLIKVL
jgi:hypothetical protein